MVEEHDRRVGILTPSIAIFKQTFGSYLRQARNAELTINDVPLEIMSHAFDIVLHSSTHPLRHALNLSTVCRH